MSTSAARVLANRRNAARSTGPSTEEGKSRSRKNALKHGLTATVVDLDFHEVEGSGEQGTANQNASPTGPGWGLWLTEQLGRVMAQIDRAQGIEQRLRDQAAWRALAVWDEDRKLDAEELGASLQRDPSLIMARLRQTPQGCDWLITRWGWLARAAEEQPEGWTEAQAALAFDLLGTGEEGRIRPIAASAELPLAMIDELQAHRSVVDQADEIAQAIASDDQADLPTRDLARLRRYETALYRRLHWLRAELGGDGSGQQTHQTGTAPNPVRVIESFPPTEGDRVADTQDDPEPNEANGKRILDETKPTGPEPEAELTLQPTRNRPNLATLSRKDRRKRQKRDRNRRSA